MASRQESEFNPHAVSHAGARGLMQLMPATAKIVARQISVPYRLRDLTADPSYNAMLGSAHLGDLMQDFTGSYIMTIAAYNAGPSRVREWVDTYGDPRAPGTDPIDWVETIPFEETRNYVQRVLENTGVYRSRLANQPTPVRIQDDITRNVGPEVPDGPTRRTPMERPRIKAALNNSTASARMDEDAPDAATTSVLVPVKRPVTDATDLPTPRKRPAAEMKTPLMQPIPNPREADALTTGSID